MKHSKGRHRPHGLLENDLEKSLRVIVDFFSEEWLNSDNDHPLHVLWKRTDILSTIELYTFGKSLLSIKDHDTTWVKKTIEKIKTGNENNIIGFVFEIISAAMIKNGENQELILPPVNYPAIDLIVRLIDNSKINISCKNRGLSDKNKLFNKNAEEVESIFLEFCKKFDKNRVHCNIICNKYAEEFDWKILKSGIEHMVNSFDGKELHYVIANTWFISFFPLQNEESNYSDDYLTHTFSLTSPFHQFERNNQYLKFQEYCDEMKCDGIKQNDDEINIFLIHLPETASLNDCQKWAEEYLNENKDRPIAGIFFIKNVIATDFKKNTNFLSISKTEAVNDFFKLWFYKNKSERLVHLKAVVGKISEEFPQRTLRRNGELLEVDDFNVNGCYMYQKGRHYVEYKDSDEDSNIKMRLIAPGVLEYAVIVSEDGKILREPGFPLDNKLILI